MEIKLDYYEIMEAIEAHLLSVYDVKLDIDSIKITRSAGPSLKSIIYYEGE